MLIAPATAAVKAGMGVFVEERGVLVGPPGVLVDGTDVCVGKAGVLGGHGPCRKLKWPFQSDGIVTLAHAIFTFRLDVVI